jgi:dolichol-phosphate mannosyltransferase
MLVVTNYNQVKEIENFLDRCEQYFPKDQTVVVDDCSTDGSDEIARKRGFIVIRHPQNMGTGAAIRSGVDYAKSLGKEWVILSSSNGKIRPEDFKTVYTPIVNGSADYVTGSRFMKDGASPDLPLFRRISIPLFSFFAFLLIGRWYSDITCGFRAYRLSIFDDPNMNVHQDWLNRYEYEYYVHYRVTKAKKWRIVEVPVVIDYSHLERKRRSHIQPIKGWWSMIRPLIFLFFRIKS